MGITWGILVRLPCNRVSSVSLLLFFETRLHNALRADAPRLHTDPWKRRSRIEHVGPVCAADYHMPFPEAFPLFQFQQHPLPASSVELRLCAATIASALEPVRMRPSV